VFWVLRFSLHTHDSPCFFTDPVFTPPISCVSTHPVFYSPCYLCYLLTLLFVFLTHPVFVCFFTHSVICGFFYSLCYLWVFLLTLFFCLFTHPVICVFDSPCFFVYLLTLWQSFVQGSGAHHLSEFAFSDRLLQNQILSRKFPFPINLYKNK
jgi:hypothetical protein